MAPKKAPVDAKGAGTKDASVIKRLHQILKTADLEKTTVKNIQKQLEGDLGVPMSDRKQFIRDEVRCRSTSSFSSHSRTSRILVRANGASASANSNALQPRSFAIIPANGNNFQTSADVHHAPFPPPAGREVPEVQRRQEDGVSNHHARIRTRPLSPSPPT
jgi:hypothetical protein